jgi:hypothetical protein
MVSHRKIASHGLAVVANAARERKQVRCQLRSTYRANHGRLRRLESSEEERGEEEEEEVAGGQREDVLQREVWKRHKDRDEDASGAQSEVGVLHGGFQGVPGHGVSSRAEASTVD